ncbi:HDOD domain-containing protein [Paludibacterium paludis]|uniref:HDOD domain-containing protein n=1 Tax=Paludibacterium paludis TaxID=1225769 RepID=A0A918P727_9NEIS|nr:HDOD domain-containing protein [Paludibacterium paludis]GGY27843.1 hypothetical protein GCM10011289_33990 [Paludibacterium paludis]
MGLAEEFTLSPERVAEGIGRLPSLPALAMELLQHIDGEPDTGEVAEMIGQDPVLTGSLLRIANSSFYGLQGRIGTIPDAITVLGLGNVRTLAMSMALANVFNRAGGAPVAMRRFWQHSGAVAICTKSLARRLRVNESAAFAAGLLHDIGRLVLQSAFPGHFSAVCTYQQHVDCEAFQAENTVLGTDHAQIGAWLARSWNFPDTLQRAIAYHHTPDCLEANRLAGLVHVADCVVHALDICEDEQERVPRIDDAVWRCYELPRDQMVAVLGEVETHFGTACDILLAA